MRPTNEQKGEEAHIFTERIARRPKAPGNNDSSWAGWTATFMHAGATEDRIEGSAPGAGCPSASSSSSALSTSGHVSYLAPTLSISEQTVRKRLYLDLCPTASLTNLVKVR